VVEFFIPRRRVILKAQQQWNIDMRFLAFIIISIGLSVPAHAAKYKFDPYPIPGPYGGLATPALSQAWANTYYLNPELDRMLESANAELDSAKRQKMYQGIRELISDSIPEIDGQEVAKLIENMKQDFCGAIGKGNFKVSFRVNAEIDVVVITGTAGGGIEMTVECGG
jgi:hypothetical protein